MIPGKWEPFDKFMLYVGWYDLDDGHYLREAWACDTETEALDLFESLRGVFLPSAEWQVLRSSAVMNLGRGANNHDAT